MDGYGAALGGHGGEAGKPRITAAGRTWVFSFDVPQFLANMERLAEETARLRLRDEIDMIPGKDVPGSWGDRQATGLFDAHLAKVRAGACKPKGEFFAALYGDAAAGVPASPDGALLTLVATLRVHHPDCTLADAKALVIAEPVQVRAVMDQMGKVLAAQAAAAQTRAAS